MSHPPYIAAPCSSTGGTLRSRVWDFSNAETACELLRDAAQLIREDPNRRGSLLSFGLAGQLVMTGDLHGNQRNFEKLQRFCNLEANPGRSVILHELMHEEITAADQVDRSIDLLLRAAAWKCEFPDNVFFLQSNHELAQLRGQEITKAGRSVLYDFERGVALRFGAKTPEVLAAVNEYVAALPLAARTGNGLFLCHSLPDPLLLENFDLSIFEREPRAVDLEPGGAAYSLVWGRFHAAEAVERFARRLNVDAIIVGHTPQDTGYAVIGPLIILASDHNHGTFLPIDLSRRYTPQTLEAAIRKFVSVP